MSDEKIFNEIKGIFSWMKVYKKEELKIIEEASDVEFQLQQFFNFIDLEVTEEEIKALKELVLTKKQQQDKKNLDYDSKKDKEQIKQISAEDLIRVFVQDEEQAENDKKELLNAFRVLTPANNPSDEEIDFDRLEEMLSKYKKDFFKDKQKEQQII